MDNEKENSLKVGEVVRAEGTPDNNKPSLESLVGLILTRRLSDIANESQTKIKELQDRQKIVRDLHDVMRAVNAYDQGDIDLSKDQKLKDLLKRAKELGVDIKEGKTKYTVEERARLIDNLRMTVEDYNMQNDLQLQALTRLTSEIYESYQLAKSILKPLHDDKINKARAMVLR